MQISEAQSEHDLRRCPRLDGRASTPKSGSFARPEQARCSGRRRAEPGVPARKTVLGLVLRAAAMAALAGVLMRLFGIASRASVGAIGEVGRPGGLAELFQ